MHPPATWDRRLLNQSGWAKILPFWNQLTFTFDFPKGQDLDPRALWKGQELSTCSEGSRGDSWRAKGAWKSIDHIYKLKFSLESLFAPHRDHFLLQKCRGKVLRICWKHINKSITYLAFAPCRLQRQSAPEAEPCYFAIVLRIYGQCQGSNRDTVTITS